MPELDLDREAGVIDDTRKSSLIPDYERTKLLIRGATSADAHSIIGVHRAAIHGCAASAYEDAILRSWERTIDSESVVRLREVIESKSEWMPVAASSKIIVGFGSIATKDSELRSLYVHTNFGRMGIASHILAELQRISRDLGPTRLETDASLNGVEFYLSRRFTTAKQKPPCIERREHYALSKNV